MRYDVIRGEIRFQIENPIDESKPNIATVSIGGLRIPATELDRFCSAACRFAQGKALKTQHSIIVGFVRPLIRFFSSSSIAWPATSDEWQVALLGFQRFHLLDETFSKASAKTRIQVWLGQVRPKLDFLKEEEIIPLDVIVPDIEYKSEGPHSTESPTLGRHGRNKNPAATTRVQKLLVDISYSQSDADYLDHVESRCRGQIELLRRVCIRHWEDTKADHAMADRLRRAIPPQELDRAVFQGLTKAKPRIRTIAKCSSEHPQGLEWALAVGSRLLEAGGDVSCVSGATLTRSGYFGSEHYVHLRGHKERFESLTQMPKEAYRLYKAPWVYYRLLKILTPVDLLVAALLLQIEHPTFTPESIQGAKLVSSRGSLYLLAGDTTGSRLFSVNKPRAGARKFAVLSPLARDVIEYTIAVTRPIRRILKLRGDRNWRYLFLGFQRGGVLGPPRTSLSLQLTDPTQIALTRLYPELEAAGLSRGMLDFRRIRNTQGLIRWFDTGSVIEMSRSLGNSTRVALQHYVPQALLHAWNVRLVRRMQQTIVLLAAVGESYLLDVSDFTNMRDLLAFVEQVVVDNTRVKSPIGVEVSRQLVPLTKPTARHEEGDQATGVLNIRASTESLALLYAFADWTRTSGRAKALSARSRNGLSAQSLVDVATMIRHACEADRLPGNVGDVIDIPTLRRHHHAALALQPTYERRFREFSFTKTWDQ